MTTPTMTIDPDSPPLGRNHIPDARDARYPMSTIVPQATPRRWRYHWANGYWGDQGPLPHCVAYAWLHKVADGPRTTSRSPHVEFTPAIDPLTLYCQAQSLDPWPGDCSDPRYEGTSVRAGAKALVDAGIISQYRWANDAMTVVNAVLEVGPVVVGTSWYSNMTRPDPDTNLIHPSGVFQGGHAYVVNGVNRNTGLVRIKNSWGRAWGHAGSAWLSIADLDDLLSDFGEACLPVA